MDSGVEELKKVRELLKIYRQSVLNAAFNGKLTEEWRNQQNEDWKYELVADSNKSENSKFQLPEDWNQTNIGSICNISMGQSPPGDTYNKENKGLPLINGPVEFGPNPFSKTVLSKWTTKPTKICEEGDLLLCVRGSTTGRQNIAGFKACLGRGDCSIRATKCYQLFVNHYFNFSRSKIFELGTGSTFPNISREQIYNYPISLPSLNEQKKIVQEIEFRLSIADEVEKTINESLQKAESLKQSILKKAFEGKLV